MFDAEVVNLRTVQLGDADEDVALEADFTAGCVVQGPDRSTWVLQFDFVEGKFTDSHGGSLIKTDTTVQPTRQ
ncbi:hypothetical protein D3C86_1620000 [compost metagenome]